MESKRLDYPQLTHIMESRAGQLFVLAGQSLTATGLDQRFKLAQIPHARFSQFSENPKFNELVRIHQAYRASKATTILAVGGGTAMDLAKLLKLFAKRSKLDRETVRRESSSNLGDPNLPALYLIPTTFGTGSEATHFSVLYIDDEKHSIASSSLLIDGFLLDGTLAESLPLAVKGSTCLDALAQAIESFWCQHKTQESAQFATDAIKGIIENYENYLREDFFDAKAAQAMAEAAHLAGRAINVTKTTAPHALSYHLSSQYGLRHGHAVALFLRGMFSLTDQQAKLRGNQSVLKDIATLYQLLGVDCADEAEDLINNLLDKAGLERSWETLGISSDSVRQEVIDSVNEQRLANHPVELSRDLLFRLFDKS